MQESDDKIVDLILKSLREEISEGEKSELDKLIAGSPAYRRVYNELKSGRTLKADLRSIGQVDTEYWWQKITEKVNIPKQDAPVKRLNNVWWKIAAAVAVLFVGAGVYYFILRGDRVYTNLQALTTPKGKQYSVTLSDGSIVVLNAASTLRYPERFAGKERYVEITGEGYFTVKSSSIPFKVKIKPADDKPGAEVLVTGTEFNIKAYKDESEVTTTLVKGEIRITAPTNASGKNRESRVLTPGEQAIITPGGAGSKIEVSKVADIENAIPWQRDSITFNNIPFKTIMRDIERWYDVEVAYKGELPEKNLTGGIGRFEKLAVVLAKLQAASGFRLEQRESRVIVTP